MKRWGSEVIIEVEDVIKPEKVDEYKKQHAVTWQHLSDIAQQIIILRRLSNFPYQLFVPEDRRVFWRLTNKSFFDSVVIAFSAIFDKSSELSLRRFKNKIFDPKQYRVDKIDLEVDEILRERTKGFEKKIAALEEKITEVRNHHIAHLDWKKVTEPESIVPYQLSIDVLQQLLDASSSVFHVLGFSAYYDLRSWDYGQSRDERKELDIDEIFELVAGQSYWFCDDPIIDFDEEYEKLSDKDKVIFDEWRKRLGK